MKVWEHRGYEFHVPTSGGKAGKGCNVTSTVQVRAGSQILKQFRFKVADVLSRARAIDKAKAFLQTYIATHP